MPYIGNEEWIGSLEAKGILTEKQAWRPWYAEKGGGGKPPAGYATAYDVKGAPDKDFSFVTIRLAGHMVPSKFPQSRVWSRVLLPIYTSWPEPSTLIAVCAYIFSAFRAPPALLPPFAAFQPAASLAFFERFLKREPF